MAYKGILKLAAVALLAASASAVQAAPILFWSSQGTPAEEQQRIRDNVLKPFGEVDFLPQDPGPYVTRIQAEAKAGSGTIGLIGGLDGDFASFPDALVNLGDLANSLASLKVNQNYLALGKLGGSEQKYIPWMQATYIMAANK